MKRWLSCHFRVQVFKDCPKSQKGDFSAEKVPFQHTHHVLEFRSRYLLLYRTAEGGSFIMCTLKMNTALEYSTSVVQEGGRQCKKSTLNDLVHLTPLRIPLMNTPYVHGPQWG